MVLVVLVPYCLFDRVVRVQSKHTCSFHAIFTFNDTAHLVNTFTRFARDITFQRLRWPMVCNCGSELIVHKYNTQFALSQHVPTALSHSCHIRDDLDYLIAPALP